MTDGEDTEICGYETVEDGPCSNPAHGEDGYCWLDTHSDDPDAPERETDGRGASEGNTNAASDGLHMSIKQRLKWFREMGEPWVSMYEDYYVEYAGKAQNESQAARLASYAVICDQLERHLLQDGIFYTDQIGDPEEMGDEAFVQKPKTQTLESLNDALTELRLGHKYEGISGGHDSGSSSSSHPDKSAMWEPDESAEV